MVEAEHAHNADAHAVRFSDDNRSCHGGVGYEAERRLRGLQHFRTPIQLNHSGIYRPYMVEHHQDHGVDHEEPGSLPGGSRLLLCSVIGKG